ARGHPLLSSRAASAAPLCCPATLSLLERVVHIEFTKHPDPDRDRRHLRAQISGQVRRRMWMVAGIIALIGLLGVVIILGGDTVFGVVMLVLAAFYLLLLRASAQRGVHRAARRFAKASSVPVHITITDVDITFASVWNRISWAWFAIDT